MNKIKVKSVYTPKYSLDPWMEVMELIHEYAVELKKLREEKAKLLQSCDYQTIPV